MLLVALVVFVVSFVLFVSCAWCCLCLWIAHSSCFSKIYSNNCLLIKSNKIRINYIQIPSPFQILYIVLGHVFINLMLILWFILEVHDMFYLLDMTFYVPPLKWLDNWKRTPKVGIKQQPINQGKSYVPFRLNSHFRGSWKVISSYDNFHGPQMWTIWWPSFSAVNGLSCNSTSTVVL